MRGACAILLLLGPGDDLVEAAGFAQEAMGLADKSLAICTSENLECGLINGKAVST